MNAYAQLQNDLKPWLPILSKATDTILDEDVSKYPIFVVYRGEIAIGLPLVEREGEEFSINASSLEEFATKGLVTAEKIDNFKEVYKDPSKFLCLFVIESQEATFIFLPRM